MWWVGKGPATLRGNDDIAAIGSNNAIAVFPPLDLVLVHLRESNDRNFRALELFAMILMPVLRGGSHPSLTANALIDLVVCVRKGQPGRRFAETGFRLRGRQGAHRSRVRPV